MPRFKGRRHWNSFSVVSGVKVEGDRLRIPAFGWLTARRQGGNPHGQGEPVFAALGREAGKWYAVVRHAVALPGREDDGTAIGLGMNAGQAAERRRFG